MGIVKVSTDNGLSFELEQDGLLEKHCLDCLIVLQVFSHMRLDIESIADTHHDSPELALSTIEGLVHYGYKFDLALRDLQLSLKERVEILKRQAAEEKTAMDAEFMAEAEASAGYDPEEMSTEPEGAAHEFYK